MSTGPSRSHAVSIPGAVPVIDRNRRSLGVDLKNPDGVETVLRLVDGADALIEGYRPGVTERLGVGPDRASPETRSSCTGG